MNSGAHVDLAGQLNEVMIATCMCSHLKNTPLASVEPWTGQFTKPHV